MQIHIFINSYDSKSGLNLFEQSLVDLQNWHVLLSALENGKRDMCIWVTTQLKMLIFASWHQNNLL